MAEVDRAELSDSDQVSVLWSVYSAASLAIEKMHGRNELGVDTIKAGSSLTYRLGGEYLDS